MGLNNCYLNLTDILQQQQQFFATGQTKDVQFRLTQLEKLREMVLNYQTEITEAVKADLHRPDYEAYFEITVISEVKYAIKHLKSWVKPRKIPTTIELFPASAMTFPEPKGVVLIIGPWNYPFQLIISPLVGAIAAGNCVVLKPSEVAPHTSQILTEMIGKTFPPHYIASVEGDGTVAQQLLSQKFAHIFFTGGTKIGRIVMEAAAKNLTPVTLELGGKNPCIIDENVPISTTAKRIAWGKFINAGQTCLAPDYLLIHKNIKADLLQGIKQVIREFYGDHPGQSPDYGRIINQHHCQRLIRLLSEGKIILGGEYDLENCLISPTLIDDISWDSPMMEEEIFGPILPILEYEDLSDVIQKINARPHPLAIYLFSQDSLKQKRILQETSSGGVCLNDTVVQVTMTELPFGGIGESGIGCYHGKATFDTFSHQKSVLKKGFWLEFNWRYAPYEKKLDFLKKMLG